ncbi:potassium transporter Kup [Rudaeicoccus suwonensis]|uniref:Probable potassium transport system protein Kup n=1 Tax=Rudaeicoccus suwonensis TaxID=657409 RepID=A0A561E780_9MICO|nr:KUP/HAK/KT family potassium transporter [Rudaeicoccus suwonensis]TWE11477.1 KUP system potassium uptake protein [Rudaeicoccus suwonensis]
MSTSGTRGAATASLTIAALGVVFGDIGTSPLYALQTAFSVDNDAVHPTRGDVFGIVSLVIWSLLLIVTFKYVMSVMHADNDGEGGVFALATLVRRHAGSRRRLAAFAMGLGVLGVSLFFGDSVITPAISVMSAVEGTKVADPSLPNIVVPVSAAILIVLFAAQRFGTARVARLFGPAMLVWFVMVAVLGVPQIVQHPEVLEALSPTYGIAFVVTHFGTAFVAMGAIVLAITGAEALYADLGHFGRAPIRAAWLFVVLPSLALSYLGQAGLVLHDRSAIANPFFAMAPSWARIPVVVVATVATVIASQAVITGAYSVAKQAIMLNFLPRLRIAHTSTQESGQIYIGAVNLVLFICVLTVVLTFRSSAALATAYGVAVTGTFVLTSTLFLLLARLHLQWPWWRLVVFAVLVLPLEVGFFSANLTKIVSGGWLPLLIAAALVTVMTVWWHGARIVTDKRTRDEGNLSDFLVSLRKQQPTRVPGLVIYPHTNSTTAPLALRTNLELNHCLQEQVLIVRVIFEEVPFVSAEDRASIEALCDDIEGLSQVTLRYGFRDVVDLPRALRQVQLPERRRGRKISHATYVLSRIRLHRGRHGLLGPVRGRLFIGLSRLSDTPTRSFHLPDTSTVEIATEITI